MEQGNYCDTEPQIRQYLFQKEETKHQKAATVPEDNTGFGFEPGRLEFTATSYEWIAVNQDFTKAHFKGKGMINGAFDRNDNPYQFMLCATERSGTHGSNIFRIKIWWEGADRAENVVYDNGAAQAMGGGSVVVHLGKYPAKGQSHVKRNS